MKINNRILISLFIFNAALFFILSCAGSSKRKQDYEARENVERELRFGRLLAANILKKFPLLADEKANLYVNKVGKSVALFAGRSDIDYSFGILDEGSINAYAAPGGYIFVTKGAIAMMKNEAELAGVLAHEVGHINNKHILKELPPPRESGGFVSTLASLLVARGAVVTSAFSEVVNKASEMLFSKGYKIEDEFEADKSAVYYTAETGYNPRGLSDFLNRIMLFKAGNQKSVVYNTHPPALERIDKLTQFITKEQFDVKRPVVEQRFIKELGRFAEK